MSSSKNEKRHDDGFNLDTMGKKDYEAELERRKYRRNASIIGTILAIFVVAVIVFTSGFSYRNIPSVTVADEKYSTVEYNYYYKTLYYRYLNNYHSVYGEYAEALMPPADQLHQETLEYLSQAKMLADEAEKNGFALSEEELAAIDKEIAEIKDLAHEHGYANVSAYLGAYYGKGMNENAFRKCMIDSQIASAYTEEIISAYEYDPSDLKAFYDENEDSYDMFTYHFFYFSGTNTVDQETGESIDAETAMANAKQKADAFAAAVRSGQSFGDVAYEYASEDQKETYAAENATLMQTEGRALSADLAPWLTDDARRAGNVTVIESTTGWNVVYFVDREDNDYATKNVRHVLIQGIGEDEQDLAMANAMLEEWRTEGATEEGFAEMAAEYSIDTGSAANGGLYENVQKGEMVPEFEEWIYDSSRKAGDTDVVKTSFGYHIMYFVGDGENCRVSIARDEMTNIDYTAWVQEQMENYEVSTGWWFNYSVK